MHRATNLRLWIGLLASTIALGHAHAAKPARYRFHLLDDKLVGKLSESARRNERAVVAFTRGSGFVVAADPARPQRILILTNHHIAGEGPPAGTISFRDGTQAKGLRTVATNPELDYALVEAELTQGPRMNGVAPLELERKDAPMAHGDRIYAIGGHTGLDTFQHPRASIAGGQATEALVAKRIADGAHNVDPVGFRTIALGRVLDSSDKPVPIKASNHDILGVEADMPNAPGMSGSPVLSRTSHRVVGLHFGGFGAAQVNWTQSSVPIDLVLRDLRARLERAQVDEQARALVQQLVDGK